MYLSMYKLEIAFVFSVVVIYRSFGSTDFGSGVCSTFSYQFESIY